MDQQWIASQKKGHSSISLADIAPDEADGSDVKYTLNPEIIHSIFTQYPGVYKAYKDNVPDKISEKEFWTKYLASKYFHRNRVSAKETSDLFDEYMNEDENDVLPIDGLNVSALNRLIDLSTTTEDHIETGNRPDSTMRPGRVEKSLPMIRRFNRHSSIILHSFASKSQSASKAITSLEADKLFMKETLLEDLDPIKKTEFAPLNINDPTKYFDGRQSTSKKQKVDDSLKKVCSLPKYIVSVTQLTNLLLFLIESV